MVEAAEPLDLAPGLLLVGADFVIVQLPLVADQEAQEVVFTVVVRDQPVVVPPLVMEVLLAVHVWAVPEANLLSKFAI